MGRVGAILLVGAAIALPSIGSAQKLYKWTDENCVVHYSDRLPPEYGSREYANPAQACDTAAQDQKAKNEIARRDRMLLETYSSVADIEDLRDRRLGLLESQIKLTETYLGNLRKRLVDLQAEAGNYKPYSTREDAPQIPEGLALDISQTTAAIARYEETLARARSMQSSLKKSFDDDIARFRELKGE